jgi:hypothetical protein
MSDIERKSLSKLVDSITECGAPDDHPSAALTGVVVIAEWATLDGSLMLTTLKYDPRGEEGRLAPWRAYGMSAAAGSGA